MYNSKKKHRKSEHLCVKKQAIVREKTSNFHTKKKSFSLTEENKQHNYFINNTHKDNNNNNNESDFITE